jgi:hypothetical protein
MSSQSPNTGSPGHQNQPGGGGSQTQHNPKPDRTAQPGQEHRPQPGQEHRPDKDRPNADPNRQGGQQGGGQGGSRP